VECKNILPPLIEENDRPTQVTRDLKGTVEGKKYTTRNRVPEPRKIPSLLEKVEHVRNSSSIIFKNDGRQTLDLVGVIVMHDYPLISEYRGVGLISIHQISTLA
jgi:hypothetical protein